MRPPSWQLLDPQATPEMLGLLPFYLDLDNPAPAREQFNHNYTHGGGWQPTVNNFKRTEAGLLYPGDPPMRPLARCQLRDETIILYECEWVAIVQPDLSYEVCRMD